MPLRRQGASRWTSWKWGQMSAIVEPIFAVIGAAIVMQILPILPYAFSFFCWSHDIYCCRRGYS